MYISDPEHGINGWTSGLGELTWRPRNPQPNTPQLQMPPYETITGFRRDSAALSGAQLERIDRVADFVAHSWTGNDPIMSIRVTGYIDSQEAQADLGDRRATAVRNALIDSLNRRRSGLGTRINWTTEDRGFSSYAKVDIFLWVGPTPPPVPPLVRTPSPAETARRIVPGGPETPEQRIDRILRGLTPAPQRRSFNQMFWAKVDDRLNSVMSRLNVPTSLRGRIREGAHEAIRRGSGALLNQIVGATELPSQVQEAIRKTVQGLLDVPVSR